MSRKLFYIVVVIVLVGSFALGTLLGDKVNLAGLIGSGEEEPKAVHEKDAEENDPVEENGFEEARPHLEEQLKQEKEQTLIMQHLEKLKGDSEIEMYSDAFEEEDKDVIAEVNGEAITMEDFRQEKEQQKQMMAMQGMDPEGEEAEEILKKQRPQIIDSLITTMVLMQKVEEEDISINEEEVEDRYQEYVQQFGGEEQLEERLEEEDVTLDEFRGELTQQLALQTYLEEYIEEHLDEEELDFSEEELRQMYEMQRGMHQPEF